MANPQYPNKVYSGFTTLATTNTQIATAIPPGVKKIIFRNTGANTMYVALNGGTALNTGVNMVEVVGSATKILEDVQNYADTMNGIVLTAPADIRWEFYYTGA